MAGSWRLGRFDVQVRVFLLLLLLFLGILDLLNLYLLGQARDALERSERGRVETRTLAVVEEVGADALRDTLRAEGLQSRLSPTALRRVALRRGYTRLALLDRAGREVLSSGPASGPGAGFAGLGEGARAALAAGRAATGPLVPERGGADTRLVAYVPLLGADGRLVGIVEAVLAVPELGRLTATYRLVLIVQVVGVLVIAALVVLFANWISRPYRRLAAAVGEARLDPGAMEASAEPDQLATAFRAVVAKLKEQDETLRRLGQEGGGLGDLVRFASKAEGDAGTGVMVVDRRGQVAAITPVAADLVGWGDHEAVSRPIGEVTRAVPGLEERVRACLEGGKPAAREVLEVHSGEGRRHVGVSISPAGGWEDEVPGALILLTDLTEIRELQDQARLRENLAEVGRLSAGIAHEFRNALGTILGYARMMQKEQDPRVRRSAAEIVREVESVGATVDEFLLYARPPEPRRVRVLLGDLIRGCAAGMQDLVDVEIEGEFGELSADDGLLRRAFSNLLRNSADAVADREGRARIRIAGRTVASGQSVQVDFEDDGPGIPAELRDQVFVPFFTTRTRGTGLGLALVQRTLVDMGGTIEAGQGTLGGALFRIRLPLVKGG